ncbi:MAG: DeoR family transcriptional regulator [Marmoricola sp.]|nr:DeoR family transcriptional regulator [Marmoricola sp.]
MAAELDVSNETVRRDLKVLEAQSLVRRHHGGAIPVETTGFESTLDMRSGHSVPEKQRIAVAAVNLLDEAESLFLDEGYTPYLVAEKLLVHPQNLTIVTASLQIAGLLAAGSGHTVLLLGGLVRGTTLATVEHWAIGMLRDFNFNVAIVGANGISREGGLTTPDPRVAAVKAAALQASQRRIFVGIHTKFGVTSFCRFGDVEDLEAIVTETALPPREANMLSALGPKVIRT